MMMMMTTAMTTMMMMMMMMMILFYICFEVEVVFGFLTFFLQDVTVNALLCVNATPCLTSKKTFKKSGCDSGVTAV
jgi:hypothetical protein